MFFSMHIYLLVNLIKIDEIGVEIVTLSALYLNLWQTRRALEFSNIKALFFILFLSYFIKLCGTEQKKTVLSLLNSVHAAASSFLMYVLIYLTRDAGPNHT